jgi:hypothetical protein
MSHILLKIKTKVLFAVSHQNGMASDHDTNVSIAVQMPVYKLGAQVGQKEREEAVLIGDLFFCGNRGSA